MDTVAAQGFVRLIRRIVGLRAYIAFVLAIVCAASCDDGTEALQVGQFANFATEDPAVALCEGAPARLDRHVRRVHEFIGEPIAESLQVQIRVVAESICPKSACYSPADQTIYVESLDPESYVPSGRLEHELTHALIDRAWGQSIPSLTEGLAESLTSSRWYSIPRPGTPVRAMLDRPAGELDYAELGYFVRFLIEDYGVERFKSVYIAAQSRSLGEIEAHFRKVYGEDFGAIEGRYLSGANRCRYQLDICDLLGAESVGASWSESFAASCLDPDFYGSRAGGNSWFATQRTLRIDTAGLYRFSAPLPLALGPDGSPSNSRAVLVRCGDCNEQQIRDVRGTSEFALPEGIYTLLLQPARDSLISLRIDYLGGEP